MSYPNNLIINQSPSINGEVEIPGDKSISHRSILIASVAEGTSKINNFLYSDDCMSTVKAMEQLGVEIENNNMSLMVKGRGLRGLIKPKSILDAGNSGTLIRLLSGILATQNFSSSITGDQSLIKRPMERIIKPLSLIGSNIESNSGKAPIKIKPADKLSPISYTQEVASAQVKSCLMLASLFINGKSTFIESIPTRDHTENMLQLFEYPIERNNTSITINGLYQHKAKEIFIPSDISSAAFFIVAALISKDSRVLMKNININPLRYGLITVLLSMGANIDVKNKRTISNELVADIEVKYSKLKGININSNIIPSLIDELPILFIACASSSGISIINGIEELRFKESDRIYSMQKGLEKIGIKVESTNDSITIKGGTINGGEIDSYDDHRVAMSFAICGLVSKKPITIKNTKNISTSFPQFVNLLRDLGMNIYEI